MQVFLPGYSVYIPDPQSVNDLRIYVIAKSRQNPFQSFQKIVSAGVPGCLKSQEVRSNGNTPDPF